MTRLKENNKALISDHKEMEIYELLDKEFRMMLLGKFSELQENHHQQNENRKAMHE